jgi:hypothetical protein
MGFLPAGCHGTKLYRALFLAVYRVSMHVRGFTCPKRSPWGSFYLTNLMLCWIFTSGLPWIEVLPVQREAHGTAFTYGIFTSGLSWIEVLPVQREAHGPAFTYGIFTSGLPWYEALQSSIELSTVFLCRLEGLLVLREVHVAASILLTLLDFYQRVANCHGLSFYLSRGKPMGLLSGTSPSDRLRPHQDQEAMASRCQSAVSALPRQTYCIVESIEFGQLEMATSLYPCRMCVQGCE